MQMYSEADVDTSILGGQKITILSYNYWFTNVYCYYTFLSIRHKSLCPRHELDVTKMVVINLGCWLWLIVFSDVPTMFW